MKGSAQNCRAPSSVMAATVAVTLTLSSLLPLMVQSVAAASDADCAGYTDYTAARDGQRCFFSNACYDTTLCCPSASTTDTSQCLDATTFACDFYGACERMNASVTSSAATATGLFTAYDPDSLYVRVLGGGVAVQCCSTDAQSTPKPNVPGYEAEVDDSTSGDGSSSSSHSAPRPVDQGCGDPYACGPNVVFARIIRTLCPALPSIFDDTFLNANLQGMCCWYEDATSASSSSTTDWACGVELLDLPTTATYHCNFNLRGTQQCCNGRVDPPPSGSSSATDAATGARANRVTAEELALSRRSLVYTYLGDVCTDRLIYPTGNGNAALGEASPVMLYTTVVVLLVAFLTAVC